jgi:nitrogen regulatory protein P-II 1
MISLVTAIIRPHALESVKAALQAAGVPGVTVSEVKGVGRQGGHTETYRGAEYTIDFLPKIKVEALVTDDLVDAAVDAVVGASRSDKIGDGKIWVMPVARVVRIRTGERGVDAV